MLAAGCYNTLAHFAGFTAFFDQLHVLVHLIAAADPLESRVHVGTTVPSAHLESQACNSCRWHNIRPGLEPLRGSRNPATARELRDRSPAICSLAVRKTGLAGSRRRSARRQHVQVLALLPRQALLEPFAQLPV